MGVKIVTPEVNGYGGRLRELVAKGAGRCLRVCVWGGGGKGGLVQLVPLSFSPSLSHR